MFVAVVTRVSHSAADAHSGYDALKLLSSLSIEKILDASLCTRRRGILPLSNERDQSLTATST